MSKPAGKLARIGAAIDRVVATIAPERGLKRALARATFERLGARHAYDGAAKDRRWHHRSVSSGSADVDLDGDTLATLRERSRDRVRNDPIARASIEALTDNVVGVGLVPRLMLPAAALGISEEQATELRHQAADIWDEWGEDCELTGRNSIEDVQTALFAQALVNGDAIAVPVMRQHPDAPTRYHLKLELVEGDRLDTPTGKLADPSIRSGVEVDKDGRPVAYWISEQHPGDAQGLPGVSFQNSRTFSRIPARNSLGRPNVLHVFVQDRPGQSRGCPVLAPVLDILKDRDDAQEAEIVGMHVGACFGAFVKKADAYASAFSRQTLDTRGKSMREEELSPGAIMYLEPGEDITFANPNRPNPNFEVFLRSLTRDAMAALGMPLEIALRDFHGTTYSQARAALLEAWRFFTRRQRWLGRRVLTPIFRMLLEEAWLAGDFKADGSFVERIRMWTRVAWVPPGRGWIDPEKEVKAYKEALGLRVQTRQQIVATMDGGNWEDTARQFADEQRLMRELDIEPPEEAPQPAAAPMGNGNHEEHEDD